MSSHSEGDGSVWEGGIRAFQSILRRLQYVGDDHSQFRKYIWSHLARTVLRGFYYRLFKQTCRDIISVGDRVRVIGPKGNVVFGKRRRLRRASTFRQLADRNGIWRRCHNLRRCNDSPQRPLGRQSWIRDGYGKSEFYWRIFIYRLLRESEDWRQCVDRRETHDYRRKP